MLWWVSVAPFGSPVVPEVNWMLIGSSNCRMPASFRQSRPLRGAAHFVYAGERNRARHGIGADLNDDAQRRQLRRVKMAGMRVPQFRRQRVDHADIVAGLERRRRDQRAAADLVQRVFQLGQPVCRVDVHQDQPGLGGGELGHHPLGVVGRPDADALARLQSQRDQSGGERIDLLAEFVIAPADALLAGNQRQAGRSSAQRCDRNDRRSFRRSAATLLVPCA